VGDGSRTDTILRLFKERFNPFVVEGHKIRPFTGYPKHGAKATPSTGAFCALLHKFNRKCTAFLNKS